MDRSAAAYGIAKIIITPVLRGVDYRPHMETARSRISPSLGARVSELDLPEKAGRAPSAELGSAKQKGTWLDNHWPLQKAEEVPVPFRRDIMWLMVECIFQAVSGRQARASEEHPAQSLRSPNSTSDWSSAGR